MDREQLLDDVERAVSSLARALSDRAVGHQVSERSAHDLPPTSWALLEHLDARGDLRVTDVAACHGVDVSSVVPRLKSLEAQGLISRRPLPTDARASLLSITDGGREALAAVHGARRELIADALTPSGPEELRATVEVANRIAAHLTASVAR